MPKNHAPGEVGLVGRTTEQGSENDGQRGDEAQDGGGGQAAGGQSALDLASMPLVSQASLRSRHRPCLAGSSVRIPALRRRMRAVTRVKSSCHQIGRCSERSLDFPSATGKAARGRGPTMCSRPDEDGSQVKIVST